MKPCNRPFPRGRRALFVAALGAMPVCATSPTAQAADVSSAWFGGSGAWTSAANWVNTPSVVQYPNNGNGGLTYDASVGAGTATLAGNITLNALTVSLGHVQGTGNLSLSDFNWTGNGTIGGTGTLTASNTITISGAGGRAMGPRNVTNGGLMTWTGTAGVFGGGTVTNSIGAIFDCQNDGFGGGAAFGPLSVVNFGTIKKTAGTETRFGGSTTINNSGIVQVDSGLELRFNGPIVQYAPGFITGGTWNVAGTLYFPDSNAITNLQNGVVKLDGASSVFSNINGLGQVSNDGTFSIQNGRTFTSVGSFNNNGVVQIGSGGAALTLVDGGSNEGSYDVASSGILTLVGASTHTFESGSQITGTGNLNIGAPVTFTSNPTFGGDVSWTSGAIGGTGSLTVSSGGTLLIWSLTGSGSRQLNTTINNAGAASWYGSTGIFGSGTFNNLAGGTFDVQASFGNAFGIPAFNNAGTITKTTTNVANFGGSMAVSNTGTIHVQEGVFNINGNIAQHVGMGLDAGTWIVEDDATLVMASGSNVTIIRPPTTVILRGADSVFAKINTLATNQGNFTISDGRDFSTVGNLANSGTLTVGPASTLTVNGTFTNTGTATGTIVAQRGGGAMPDSLPPALVVNGDFINTGVFSFNGPITVTGNQTSSGPTAFAGDLTLGAMTTVSAAGVLDAQGDGVISVPPETENPELQLAGIMRKSGGTGVTSITIPVTSDGGSFDVQSGTVDVAAISVADDSTLTKTGAGLLQLSGTVSYGTNATFDVLDGTVAIPGNPVIPPNPIIPSDPHHPAITVSGAELDVVADDPNLLAASRQLTLSSGATVKLQSGKSTTLALGGLTFAAASFSGAMADEVDATIDLADGAMVVTGGDIGTWNGSEYTGITGKIQLGRGDGSWNSASGILTSETDATTNVLTTLAVSTAQETGYGAFRGVSVSGGDVLVMYTWGGDADLNGELNGDDYFWIDSNILAVQSGATELLSFHNGDFNYDGALNGDDYFILDSNILQAQASSPFPTGAGGGGLASVPEPGVMGMVVGIAVGALGRKRRRFTESARPNEDEPVH